MGKKKNLHYIKKNIAVLASGSGSNFEAIAKAVNRNYLKANLKLLITDNKKAYVRVRAKKLGIPDIFIDPCTFPSTKEFDKEIIKILKKEKIDLVILAGYMRILTPYFVNSFKNRILNIHPALLPAFKGKNAIERAYRYGVKITGVTVHFVDRKVDHGPIILQASLNIEEKLSLKKLEEKIHKLEHKLYPYAIKLFLENRVKLKGRRVEIL